jgi:hypothetical protein
MVVKRCSMRFKWTRQIAGAGQIGAGTFYLSTPLLLRFAVPFGRLQTEESMIAEIQHDERRDGAQLIDDSEVNPSYRMVSQPANEAVRFDFTRGTCKGDIVLNF